MSLTGILLDVSGSMKSNIGSGTDEEGGPWARSIFKVIDDLIEHDASSENQVFALGVGASCSQKEIFDVIGTVQQIEEKEMPAYSKNTPATEDHINKIFYILEKNGARNIRKWANVYLVQEVVSDCMAALILIKLKSNEQFLRRFVDEFLPSACRDTISIVPNGLDTAAAAIAGGATLVAFAPAGLPVFFLLGPASVAARPIFTVIRTMMCVAEDVATSAVSICKRATKKDIHLVVEKAKCYFLKDAEADSIFSVQDANRIIRGCIDEKELSKERSRELLENVEPFIYGRTPLYQSLDKATELFKKHSSNYANHKKLLFVLSDGKPTDGSNKDTGKIDHVVSELREEGVKVVSCFITKSTDIQPKRLYNEMPPDWKPGVKLLFSLSSEVPTQLLPRAILVKRGWTIDVANNETKLFLQVNHPDHLREACNMARDVVCCQDALSDLLVSVDLDIYINQSTDSVEAKQQVGGTCYANASAAVLHLAMKRILGREGGYPDFHALKEEMIEHFGSDGANTSLVLQNVCPKYRLHCREVCLKDAMQAIVEKRPVVAKFRLTGDEWKILKRFYKNNPTGILTENEIDASNRNAHAPTYVHDVSSEDRVFPNVASCSQKEIFVDDLIEHDVSSEDHVFALGVGASCSQKNIFDVIGTVQQIEEKQMPDYSKNTPATEYHINKIFDILEKNGARNIRKWANVNLIQEQVSDFMAALALMKLESDKQFLRKFVDEFLPSSCREKIPIVPSPLFRALSTVTIFAWGHVTAYPRENIATTAVSNNRPATEEDIHQVVQKAKCYYLKDVGFAGGAALFAFTKIDEIDPSNRPAHAPTYGHAVVLTSYNSKCLTLMNSWGPEWADMGFFRVRKAKLLKLKFIDVYWELEDLTEGEKTYYDDHGSEVATKLMTSLKGLQKAEYTCPKCSETSLVTAFTGTLSNVKCPKCSQEFSTIDNAGNILALNMYLTSLSR